ncbi:Fe-S cluster assembly protein SufD [Aquihabitans sp. McL0605]|uniref:Fe-S cluster assembly protein SufD n=1 Tax=Aquihabitans sp. McL0605 TaxID=3415671 RepID=UPI003CEF065E
MWRYSRVGELALDTFTPTADAVATDVPVPQEWIDKGVSIARAADLTDGTSGLGSVAAGGPDVFATLNDAFSVDPIVITVPRGVRLTEPLIVGTHLSGEHAIGFPRLVVLVGEAAEAIVIERTTSSADTVLSVPLTELRVERGGRLDFVAIQQLGEQAWQVGSLVADVGQEAHLRVGLVGLGGAYARLRTDCTLSGRGGTGDLLAAYFGDGDQTLDFRTFQHHNAPDTTSNLLFKGAVGGHSRSVYTGLIRVDKEARGTNAFQTNRNVKLSEHAWAESVPNLEIETNDVRCSHASTVGPVDPEQRFYLESRGVPPTIADRLIVAGFFDEVVRQLPDAALVAEVTLRIAEKLDRVAEDLR